VEKQDVEEEEEKEKKGRSIAARHCFPQRISKGKLLINSGPCLKKVCPSNRN
jgi:hypothetical protein